MTDHRHNSSNPITTIVAVGISDPDVKGKEPIGYCFRLFLRDLLAYL
jgi:hypothetical protein